MLRRIFMTLLLLEVLWIALFGISYWRWTFDWRLNGERVPATLTGRGESDDGRFVTYRYTAAGTEYSATWYVTEDFFNVVQVGDQIEVAVSPYDPAVAGIPGQGGGDFRVPVVPGTPFNLSVIAYGLPVLIVVTLVGLVVVGLLLRRKRGTDPTAPQPGAAQ